MKRKDGIFTMKAMSAGQGVCVFATMDVIDKDGDVTLSGAFGTQVAKLCGAHDWSAPPIGMAKIHEEGMEAIAEMQFNLNMPSAEEWHKSLKFNFDNGINQEFSYGFDVLSSRFEEREGRQVRILEKLKVHEVSPVMIGAGMGTRMTMMKSGDLRMEDHGEQTEQIVRDYIDRVKALATQRRIEGKEGRQLSRANRERLTRVADGIAMFQELEKDIRDLLMATDPDAEKTVNLLALLEVKRLAGLARRRGRQA